MEDDQELERERRRRPLAAAAAALTGLLTLIGSTYVEISLAEPPRAWVLDSLERLESGEAIGRQTSLLLPFYDYVADNIATVVISHALAAAGMLMLGGVMLFLGRATQARGGALPRFAPRLALFGAVPLAVGIILVAVGTGELYEARELAKTVDGVQSDAGAEMLNTGRTVWLLGAIATVAGIVLVCLHAMRVGLLTRFLGVLGILVGVVLAFAALTGAVTSPVLIFWVFALALLLAGRWPGGDPPAWREGVAVPWPSAAEVREERDRAAREAAPEPPKPQRAGGGPSPATSAKKKRKRRG